MVSKLQTYMKSTGLRKLLLLVFSLSLFVMSGCTALISPLMTKTEKLYNAGKFEETIQYLESDEGKFTEREKRRIINENTARIKASQDATMEFLRYQFDLRRLVESLIELGQFDKALKVCEEGLKDTLKIEELFRKYKFDKSKVQVQYINETIFHLTRLKGYITWFKTGDEKKTKKFFNASLTVSSSDKGDISFFDSAGKKKISYLAENCYFYDKIFGEYAESLKYCNEALSEAEKMTLLDIDGKYFYELQINRRLMNLYVKMGELEEARKVLQRYDDRNRDLIFKMGRIFISNMDWLRGYITGFDASAGAMFGLIRDFDNSKKYFEKASSVIKSFETDPKSLWDEKAIATYYVFYGTYYLGLQNKYKEAIESIDKGIRYMKPYYLSDINEELDIENAYIYSGELHFLVGDYDIALEQAKAASRFAQRYYSRVADSAAHTLMGQIYYKKGNKKASKQSYEKALEMIRNIESTENWKLYYGLGQVNEDLGNQGKALEYYKKAIWEVEKLWNGRFKDTAKQVSFIDNRLVVFEPVIRIYAKQGKTEDAINYMEKSKSRTFFETSVFSSEEESAASVNINPATAKKPKKNISDIDPMTAVQIRRTIPDKSAILEYYVGEESVIGAVISKKGMVVKNLKITPVKLKEQIMAYRDDIENVSYDYKSNGVLLYDELVRPFEKNLSGIEKIGIIPHGVLHYLPFQALISKDESEKGIDPQLIEAEKTLLAMRDCGSDRPNRGVAGIRQGKASDDLAKDCKTLFATRSVKGIREIKDTSAGNQDVKTELESVRSQIAAVRVQKGVSDSRPVFLVDKYKIFYAPSSTILNYVQKTNAGKKEKLLAVGSPPPINVKDLRELGVVEVDILPKLPSTKIEVQEVGALFSSDAIFTDEAATETIAESKAPQYDLLLFSTHGMLNRKEPLNSAIFFNKDSINTTGRMTVSKIEKMGLNANLVVLSACQTGLMSGYEGVDEKVTDAKFPHGDDLVGLQRAFIKSGSASVMSTLWEVADDSTSSLVVDFFKRFKNGSDKASALRDAELMMMNTKKDWEHPYFWAPFVLSGDWR